MFTEEIIRPVLSAMKVSYCEGYVIKIVPQSESQRNS